MLILFDVRSYVVIMNKKTIMIMMMMLYDVVVVSRMSSDGRKWTRKFAGEFYSTVFLCVKNNKVSNVSKTVFFSLRQKSPHKTVQNKNSPANFISHSGYLLVSGVMAVIYVFRPNV